MASVGKGSFYHYQPPPVGLRCDEQPTASNLRLPAAHARGNDRTSLGPSKKTSGRLQDYDPIEIVDMSGLPREESHNPIRAPALGLDYTERDAEGTIPYYCFMLDGN